MFKLLGYANNGISKSDIIDKHIKETKETKELINTSLSNITNKTSTILSDFKYSESKDKIKHEYVIELISLADKIIENEKQFQYPDLKYISKLEFYRNNIFQSLMFTGNIQLNFPLPYEYYSYC